MVWAKGVLFAAILVGTTTACVSSTAAAAAGEGYDEEWYNGSPATWVKCHKRYCIYRQVWNAGGSFFRLHNTTALKNAAAGPPPPSERLSRNLHIDSLHVESLYTFVETIQYQKLKGLTLLIEYPYMLHQGAIGHWGGDVFFPMYSMLKSFGFPKIDRVLLLCAEERAMIPWVMTIMTVALGLKSQAELPRIYLQPKPGINMPFAETDRAEWRCYERVLSFRDTFTGADRGFYAMEDGQEFRNRMYALSGLQVPAAPIAPSRRSLAILYHKAPPRPLSSSRQVHNEDEFLQVLQRYGNITTVTFTADTSVADQVRTMASADLFVSVHTSAMTNVVFMRPGAAVLEVSPCYFEWGGLAGFMERLTTTMGDIFHTRIPCQSDNLTVFHYPSDERKYRGWTMQECMTEGCVEAHVKADITVDIEQMEHLIDRDIARVLPL